MNETKCGDGAETGSRARRAVLAVSRTSGVRAETVVSAMLEAMLQRSRKDCYRVIVRSEIVCSCID